jgi:hypothetical protein
MTPKSAFGCARCCGDEPRTAWEATKNLEHVRTLVDDSHFIVQVLRCKLCRQQFLWVTTEIVDWAGGDDAQFRRVVPLTAAEAETLFAEQGEVTPAMLVMFGRENRRYLRFDWPTGVEKPLIRWETGALVFVPDGAA